MLHPNDSTGGRLGMNVPSGSQRNAGDVDNTRRNTGLLVTVFPNASPTFTIRIFFV